MTPRVGHLDQHLITSLPNGLTQKAKKHPRFEEIKKRFSDQLNYFKPGKWVAEAEIGEEEECEECNHKKMPKYIQDEVTQKSYLNESRAEGRAKCFLLALGTPIGQPLLAAWKIVANTVKIASLSHFWSEKAGQRHVEGKSNLGAMGKDTLRILATPLGIIGTEISAIYGIASPRDGKKWYAAIERGIYDGASLQKSFHPVPACDDERIVIRHLLCAQEDYLENKTLIDSH